MTSHRIVLLILFALLGSGSRAELPSQSPQPDEFVTVHVVVRGLAAYVPFQDGGREQMLVQLVDDKDKHKQEIEFRGFERAECADRAECREEFEGQQLRFGWTWGEDSGYERRFTRFVPRVRTDDGEVAYDCADAKYPDRDAVDSTDLARASCWLTALDKHFKGAKLADEYHRPYPDVAPGSVVDGQIVFDDGTLYTHRLVGRTVDNVPVTTPVRFYHAPWLWPVRVRGDDLRVAAGEMVVVMRAPYRDGVRPTFVLQRTEIESGASEAEKLVVPVSGDPAVLAIDNLPRKETTYSRDGRHYRHFFDLVGQGGPSRKLRRPYPRAVKTSDVPADWEIAMPAWNLGIRASLPDNAPICPGTCYGCG